MLLRNGCLRFGNYAQWRDVLNTAGILTLRLDCPLSFEHTSDRLVADLAHYGPSELNSLF